jgi:DNA polymerase III delta prime subunit
MEDLDIHKEIKNKLEYFIEKKKIPNMIFHGASGCGKNKLVNNFINSIYQSDKDSIKNYVMYVNCAHGKGIKFIREELKFFAKTNINLKEGEIFKTIVLLNADKLTIDAQSALRRCIELFSHSTRFFIIVEDKYKLLKPILSRFCEIYIPEPIVDGKIINLHTYNLEKTFNLEKIKKQSQLWLKKEINMSKTYNYKEIIELSSKLYEKGYSSLDIIKYIETSSLDKEKIYEYLIIFNKIRKEFRNEKLLILFILNFFLIRSDVTLENISFM